MNKTSPSGQSHALVWVFLVLAAALLVWGIVRYGLSTGVGTHFWTDIFARFGGPMTFRFFLQPAMALAAAVPAGIRDAKEGRVGFIWATLVNPKMRTGRLREALDATARILLLGLIMDLIYQVRVFDRFFPVEALVMAIALALIPYLIFREIVWAIALAIKR
ncbi:hypothetical protein WBP06_22960 [Novosphingobium sp. BL-8H]|uniref:hypothetical protein n=1 Tax=Novosphingobium sp. BL-8H TaxID=3127640 RepID=UPI003756C5CD